VKQPVRPQGRNKTGFTLVEMMAVVAIIAILSTLLIVGISKLQTNAKRQQTVQILENCRAMWAEYDSVNRLHFDQFALIAPGNVSLENEIAVEQQNPGYAGYRVGIDVGITRAIMSLIRSQPNIRAAMDKFPAGRMFLTSASTQANAFVPFPVGPAWAAQPPPFPCTAVVTYTDPNSQTTEEYVCIHSPTQNADGTYTPAFTPSPPDSAYWLPISGIVNGTPQVELTDPIFLDAWGNPIICCIGGQMSNVTAGGRVVTVSSPDKRLFWASAGPDGDFSKGDDNIYSFEKP